MKYTTSNEALEGAQEARKTAEWLATFKGEVTPSVVAMYDRAKARVTAVFDYNSANNVETFSLVMASRASSLLLDFEWSQDCDPLSPEGDSGPCYLPDPALDA